MARRSSIASRLFVLVFGFSVAWFSLTTALQLVLEYRATREVFQSNLEGIYQATKEGLVNALWSFDLSLVGQSLESLRRVRFLTGALVRDETGQTVAAWGQVPRSVPPSLSGDRSNVEALLEPLYQVFTLEYRDSHGKVRLLGDFVLVSDLGVIRTALADRLRLIFSNYVAITLGLMVILLIGLRRQVAVPLGRITRAIGDYRFDGPGLPPLDRPLPDELNVLWTSFEALTASLKESWLQQRVLSAILEEAAVMALVCDGDGQVVLSNAQARARLEGAVPGGGRLDRLSYGEDSGPLLAEAGQLLAEGKAWRGDRSASGSRGERFWLSVALLPLEVPDEPRARWGVMIEDVSARKLTDLYRRERDLARDSARAKSLFLANLSHEIRTPMNAVVGLTALALDEEVSPRAREYLDLLRRSGTLLLGVINDILDYSKLEDGKLVLEAVDFSLGTLLDSVDSLGRFQAQEKGLAFQLDLASEVSGTFRGDPLRLQQVLVNLVTNAVKFTDRGRIDVKVTPLPANRVRFEVRDTGVGIAPADQSRLFESFTQLDASTTRRYGGTGLGLAICRQLVTLMGGQLGLESEPGKGSLFWVEVPLTSAEPMAVSPEPDRVLAGLRVLLAEDNKVNQLVAKEILAKVGIHLAVVSDGRKAVEAVVSREFDLVLMDLQMPVMDGLEATRLIRQTRDAETLPILAMTAHTFSQERDACLAAGMQDLVPKPVNPEVLYSLISRWCPAGSRP